MCSGKHVREGEMAKLEGLRGQKILPDGEASKTNIATSRMLADRKQCVIVDCIIF